MEGSGSPRGGDTDRTRARSIANGSAHTGVTPDLLAGTGRYSKTYYLYEEPAVSYLEAGEHVHFAFYNEMKGVGVGDGEDTFSPDNGGISIILVTDHRVLILVGRQEGDREFSIHYDTVTEVAMESTGLHYQLIIETVSDTYQCWINTRCGEKDLQEAVSCIQDRMADPHDLITDATGTEIAERAGETAIASDGGGDTATPNHDDRETRLGGSGPERMQSSEPSEESPLETIAKLHDLRTSGAITEAEYHRKKAELLDDV